MVQAEVFEKNCNLIESVQLWTTFELHWHKHELQDVDTDAHNSTKTETFLHHEYIFLVTTLTLCQSFWIKEEIYVCLYELYF